MNEEQQDRRGSRHRAAKARGLKVRALTTAGAVLVAGAGVAVLVHAGSGSAGAEAAGPIKTSVQALALSRSADGTVELPARSTKSFSSLGVTWNSVSATLGGTVEVRTRSSQSGQWTDWQALGTDDDTPDAADLRPGVRGGTDPRWVGPSNGVQVRVVSTKGIPAVPAGLAVDLVDPGSASTTDVTAPVGYAMDDTPSSGASASSSTATAPSASDSADPAVSPSDGASASASDSNSDSPSDGATDSPTASASASPSGSGSATDAPTATGSTGASASPSTSAAPWPTQLPTLAQAYPSCGSASTATGSTQTAPSPMPTQTVSSIATPPIITRAQWGANECTRESGYPDYGTAVKVVFVHHTDDTNSYTCAQSPAIVRSIYAYHVQVEGWRDIGYNFLVDKCGDIFEGRFGGAALPVVGAQTYGMNTNSMGIAAMGTYTDLSGGDSKDGSVPGATPSKAMLGAIADLAAWKLGMSGTNPVTGTGVLTEGGTYAGSGNKFQAGQQVTLHAVSGHRDGFATDCPGNQLYDDLPAIRSYAAGPVTGLAITNITGGAGRSASAFYTRGPATVSWTTATPGQVIAGFDVLVDGKAVAHTGGLATSAAITVGAGRHIVTVVATHLTGARTTSAPIALVGDTTPPVFTTAPALALRTGTVSNSAVPVVLGWRAADNNALASVLSIDPAGTLFGPTTTSWATATTPGRTDWFGLRASDAAGNTATAWVGRAVNLVQETSTTRKGSWSRGYNGNNLGGYAYSSSAKGASVSWTFTGRSVAWIAARTPKSGQAYIYVDGARVALVDLKSATTLYRQAIWTKSWAASGRHTITIVVVGTPGRPTVTADAIATLN